MNELIIIELLMIIVILFQIIYIYVDLKEIKYYNKLIKKFKELMYENE